MKIIKKVLKDFYYFIGSLKFAVIVIIALAIVSSVGTIIESKYNAEVAQVWVYRSIYMYIVMYALVVSLIVSTLHRWPWKKKHIPFLTVHLGLLIIIYGSWVTGKFGVDGSLIIGLKEENRWVSIPTKEFEVYASFDGERYISLFREEVNFLNYQPDIKVPVENGFIEVDKVINFALKNTRVLESEDPNAGPAIRFYLKNPLVDFSEWILSRNQRIARLPLGPATIVLARDEYEPTGENELILKPLDEERVAYEVAYEDGRPSLRGELKEGDVLQTDWMGLEFSMLKYVKRAKEESEFIERDYPSDLTTSAIRVRFDGKEYWQEINSILRFFTDTTAYILSWRNKQIDIGFPIFLEEFHLGKYPGTLRAASYASSVRVPDLGLIEISMNEPLKHKGFTFYQASYQEDLSGNPISTILSVNYDPGRWIKYLGSFLVVLGSVLLFYFRKYYAKPAKLNNKG